MEPPFPLSPPLGAGSEAAAQWTEYKQLYERYLELFARSIQKGEEYNRLSEEHNRLMTGHLQLQQENSQRQERQAKLQTRFSWWFGGLLLFGLLCLTVTMIVRSLLKQ